MAQSATQQTPALAARPQSVRIRRILPTVVIHAILIVTAALFVIPFLWLLITSLKPLNQVFTDPPQWIPQPFMWRNYYDALTNPAFPFGRLLRNTIFYTVTSTIGTTFSSALIAYGFARMEFWGRGVLFGITLATMMIPGIVTLIPTYILFRKLGWVGTYAPLIVPAFFGSAFNIFLLRQFMLTIPWDLSDAAYVDGASDWTIFTRIMLPLIKPALLVVAVFHFMYTWNDFMGPLIYLDNSTQYPLVLGLFAFQSRFGNSWQWHHLMAASMAVTLPLIVLFFVAQRYFIGGITLTGIKE